MRLLLITSRDTRRWVLPKGNPIRGLDPHLAAAREAYEEAGVTGIACPSAVGSYQYAKRRNNGSVRTATVAVFPLAFVAQLESWPEQAERQTQWFTLPDAANAVDEADLGAIISQFTHPAPVPGRTERAILDARRRLQERIPPLQWFQALMPRQGRFFEHFEAHALTLVAGADALAKLLHGGASIDQYCKSIFELEEQADEIARVVLQDVRRTFVTPFDRSAITSLIGSMDDAIDQMNATAKSITLFEVKQFAPHMLDMAGIIVEAARVTAEAIPLLRSVGNNSARLHDLTARLIKIEGDADDIHDAGVKALYKANGEASALAFVVGREIYGHLEKVVDRFEDVANEIQGLVIDHA